MEQEHFARWSTPTDGLELERWAIRCITQTLPEEGESSRRGAGWRVIGETEDRGRGSLRAGRPRVDKPPAAQARWRGVTGRHERWARPLGGLPYRAENAGCRVGSFRHNESSVLRPAVVWDGAGGLGGDPECEHDWASCYHRELLATRQQTRRFLDLIADESRTGGRLPRATDAGAFCGRCGAWRGDLGLEPAAEL